jgi:transmembrane sensor
MDSLGWTIVARYLEKSCTAAEGDAVERWASEDPRNREELESIRRIWNRAALLPSGRRIDAMFDELSARMRGPTLEGADSTPETAGSRDPRRPRAVPRRLSIADPHGNPYRRIPAIAALLLAAVLLGGNWYVGRSRPSEPASSAALGREYTTLPGERATIHLPDGSQLTLAGGSTLRISADFGKNSREISLDGEAFFDVVHDTNRPFRVHIKDAIVEDVGTSFDVRSYSGDPTVIVAVKEGAVTLGPNRLRSRAVEASSQPTR